MSKDDTIIAFALLLVFPRPGRQRRAGCFDIASTGGNISVGPYLDYRRPAGPVYR
jgi:hypothetical protein